MLPMMGGIVGTSVVSGQMISRSGRYRRHPIVGSALSVLGMWLLSRLETDTPRLHYSVWMFVLGAKIGMVMPVLVLAVQNSVRPADLGTATSANNYFRQIGGSVGAAVFGTLFAGGYHRRARRAAPRRRQGRRPTPSRSPPARARPAARTARRLRPGLRGRHAAHLPVPRAGARPRPAHRLLPQGETTGVPPHPHRRPGPEAPHFEARVPSARSAQSGGIPVCGTVQHPDGTPVPRAALTLIDVQGQQTGRGASGADGRYALATPGPGSYVLIAAAGGHQPQAVSVTVGERPVELDVVLGGAGYSRAASSPPTARPYGTPPSPSPTCTARSSPAPAAAARAATSSPNSSPGSTPSRPARPRSARRPSRSPCRPRGRPVRTSSWRAARCSAAPCGPADGRWRTRGSRCSTPRATSSTPSLPDPTAPSGSSTCPPASTRSSPPAIRRSPPCSRWPGTHRTRPPARARGLSAPVPVDRSRPLSGSGPRLSPQGRQRVPYGRGDLLHGRGKRIE